MQRMEDEARQDRLKTKRILEALASGHQSSRQKQKDVRGHYGLDDLAAEGITTAGDAANKEENEEDEDGDFDFDDNEELQASYLSKMTSRVKGQREQSEGVDELTDEDEDEDEEEGDGECL